jgi:hypothetical protein
LSLCFLLTEHHAMKAYWGSGGISPRILDLSTRWRRVVSFVLRPLYPQGKNPLSPTHLIGGWVGPTAGLDAVVKRKFSSPYPRTRTPDHPARIPAPLHS